LCATGAMIALDIFVTCLKGEDFLFIYSWNVSPHPKMNAISQLDWRSSVAERLIPVERNEIEVAQLRFSFPPPSISLISPL
jgi:hypothetical protein